MSKIEVLNPTIHAHLKINTHLTDSSQYQVHMVPVLVSELLALSANFPLFFSKNVDNAEFKLVALLGFDETENLYIDHGEWTSNSIPKVFDREPFHIDMADNKVFIDVEHQTISSEQGEALFDEAGEPSPLLQRVLNNLQQIKTGLPLTENFVSEVLKYDLLEAVKLKIKFKDETEKTFEGLYNISQEKLSKLSKDELFTLQQSGLLQGLYLVLHSVEQVKTLVTKKNLLLA